MLHIYNFNQCYNCYEFYRFTTVTKIVIYNCYQRQYFSVVNNATIVTMLQFTIVANGTMFPLLPIHLGC